MSDIGSATFQPTQIQPSNTDAYSRVLDRGGPRGVEGAGSAVGAGVTAGVDGVPDPLPGLAAGVLMASLAAIMPKMSGEQLDALVVTFTEKMKDASDASNKDQVKIESAAKRAQIAEKKAKIEEAIKKQQEADEKTKHVSTWDKIKLALEYTGAVLAIAGGIVTMVATSWSGVGIFAGSMMIMSGLCMLGMAVDDTVKIAQQEQGKGDLGMFGMMFKQIGKDQGMSDADAEKFGQKGAMGCSIALGGMAAIFGVAGGVAGIADLAVTSFGAASAGADLAMLVSEAGLEGASTGTMAAEEGTEEATVTAEDIADLTQEGLDVANEYNQMGTTAADVGSGVDNYKTQNLQADAKTAQANAKRLEAMGKMMDAVLEMAIAALNSSGNRFNTMLDTISDAIQDSADTMSNAGLRA